MKKLLFLRSAMTSTCCLLHWAIILISCLISSIWQSWSSPILEILSSFGLQDTTFSWFSSYLTSHFFSVFFCWLLLSSSFHFGKILGFLLFIISPLIMLPRYRVSNTNHTLTPPNVDLQSGSLSWIPIWCIQLCLSYLEV